MTAPIRAAGGVPVRGAGDAREVLLVHRRRYGDWTFPKGKLEPDEDDATCARREVEEETGLACELGRELPSTTYRFRDRPKVVRYWLMTPVAGDLAPRPGEIDDARWVSCVQARELLTYEHDRALLDALDG